MKIKKLFIHVTGYINELTTILLVDLGNKIKYGPKAPLYAERIWINPRDCKLRLSGLGDYSGRVVEEWPPKKTKSINKVASSYRIKSCINRWVHGKPWETTTDYQKKLQNLSERGYAWDGECYSEKELLEKYKTLDHIFKQVKKEGRIKPGKEIKPGIFRESGTFLIHVGPNGELYLGGGGHHRFAMALILNLDLIPAQIGCVHKNAISYLPHLRNGNYR